MINNLPRNDFKSSSFILTNNHTEKLSAFDGSLMLMDPGKPYLAMAFNDPTQMIISAKHSKFVRSFSIILQVK
ncbi:hypothetical protein EDS67_09070 [candidate division KSB1 bacterium]|nr:MAG: hypothetical protein EDS67_09070 [candidate division KSB1 bacterium]MBC6946396.1 hypothetical protein [candidate division KSB1 bacterium]